MVPRSGWPGASAVRSASGRALAGGWWFATEAGVQLSDAEVFRPDVAGCWRERPAALPAEVPIALAPGWVCEILSTNRRNDLITKKRAYHRHRVGHSWLVDPAEETLAVHAGTRTVTSRCWSPTARSG